MTILAGRSAPVKPRRTYRAGQPIKTEWGLPVELLARAIYREPCPLIITAGDDPPEVYWVSAHLLGFRIAKEGQAEPYDTPTDLATCDCAAGTYKADRLTCRHRIALAQALPELGIAVAF